jgi:hypothetical protein
LNRLTCVYVSLNPELNRMIRNIFVFFACLTLCFSVFSCKKDKLLSDSSARLKFSADTLFFDTVFTSIGSASRHFLVRNTYNQPINISNIRLAGGSGSPYRVNIDGSSLTVGGMQNTQIAAKDSMYIFVKVTINPLAGNPMIVADSLLFDVNGHRQHVILEAVGQDVYLHYPNKYILLSDGTSVPYSYAICGDIWKNDKPHLIYKYLVDTCVLTMLPGTRVFLHSGAVLWIYQGGTLKIAGSHNQPVTFTGDRLEQDYAGIPGQWGNIWLSALSVNNTIDWAVLKNGSVGLLVDSFPSVGPTLRLTNTIIENMSVAGIYGRGAKIIADNVVVSDCGQSSLALTIGGSYSFRQSSFADYYSTSTRNTPSILLQNYYTDINGIVWRRNLDSAHFYNCIVDGALAEEIKADSSMSAGIHFNFLFDHCLLKTGNGNAVVQHFNANQLNLDPVFVDASSNNLNILPGSGAIGNGKVLIPPIPFDLNQHPVNTPPDIGAYQH